MEYKADGSGVWVRLVMDNSAVSRVGHAVTSYLGWVYVLGGETDVESPRYVTDDEVLAPLFFRFQCCKDDNEIRQGNMILMQHIPTLLEPRSYVALSLLSSTLYLFGGTSGIEPGKTLSSLSHICAANESAVLTCFVHSATNGVERVLHLKPGRCRR